MAAAFEICFTPPSKMMNKDGEDEAGSIPKLVLAPFHAAPVVAFENVQINTKKSKVFEIYNPKNVPISVQFSEKTSNDRISFSHSVINLGGCGKEEVEVIWAPIQDGPIRKVIYVKDVTSNAKSFPLIITGVSFRNQSNNALKKKILTKKSNFNNTVVLKHNKTEFKSQGSRNYSPNNQSKSIVKNKENLIPKDNTNQVAARSTKHYNDSKDVIMQSKSTLPIIKPAVLRTSSPKTFHVDLKHYDQHMETPIKDTYLNFKEKLQGSLTYSPGCLIRPVGDVTLTNAERRSTYVIKQGFKPEEESAIEYCPLDISPTGICISPLNFDSLDSFSEDKKTLTQSNNVMKNESTRKKYCHNNQVFLVSPPVRKGSKNISPPSSCRKLYEICDSRQGITKVSSAISDRKQAIRRIRPSPTSTPVSKLSRLSEAQKGKLSLITSSHKDVKSDKWGSRTQLDAKCDTNDPFIELSLLYDDNWAERQEKDLIKWANSLLTPPLELDYDNEGHWTVDAAELWVKGSTDSPIRPAQSKENIATDLYHCAQRLDDLRNSARLFYRSENMKQMISKINATVDKKLIAIREDRDVHLDQGLKYKILNILSCYNTLWMRIALESIYGHKIVMQVNSDVGGLGHFIRKNLFTNEHFLKKCCSMNPAVANFVKPNFKDAMKKFILKKMLVIIYFLDEAKVRKLIKHDPCLFTPKSPYKSSKELMMAFFCDLVVSHGDISRQLKLINYQVEYKQTCLDEYEFSVTNVNSFRDGVVLTRLLEILFNQYDVSCKLRLPAISILQKIHNVNLAINLFETRCELQGNITSKDIVVGNRDKILSFLWQIVNKYLGPRYRNAAISIQRWWKRKYFTLNINKRIENKSHLKKIQAAIVIQRWYRNIKYIDHEFELMNIAACVIQRKFRGYMQMRKQRERYQQMKIAIKVIQSWYKRIKSTRQYRENINMIKQAVVIIQRAYKSQKVKKEYLKIKKAAITIQRMYKANREMRKCREQYVQLKRAVTFTKETYIKNRQMKIARDDYLTLRSATITVQQKYRNITIMRKIRNDYVTLKSVAIFIQRTFRNNVETKVARIEYRRLKTTVIGIQRKYRALLAMRIERTQFLNKKSAVMVIERWYTSRKIRMEYMKKKKAVILIQQIYRANKIMTIHKNKYRKMKMAVAMIEQWYNRTKQMKQNRKEFIRLKRATLIIQRKFRAITLMRKMRCEYLAKKNAVIRIQKWYHSLQIMCQQRTWYQQIKMSTIIIQRRLRGLLEMKKERKRYRNLKHSVKIIERAYINVKIMRQTKDEYRRIKDAIVNIQRWYRGRKIMMKERQHYLQMRQVTIKLQQRYRANKMMCQLRCQFVQLKRAVVAIENRYRANVQMRREANRYNEIKRAALFIQGWYRAVTAKNKQRNQFVKLVRATIIIQTKYRAMKEMKSKREQYMRQRNAVLTIQRVYRAVVVARKDRLQFVTTKKAAITLQRKYRSLKFMQTVKEEYLKVKDATITIQQWYRSLKVMEKDRNRYIAIKNAAIIIQTKYRATKEMKSKRERYARKRNAVLTIQDWYRRTRMMREDRNAYVVMKKAVVIIEERYIAYKIMKRTCGEFVKVKKAVKDIQRWYIGTKAMREEKEKYMRIKEAAILIQIRYRGYRMMKECRNEYLVRKNAALVIKQWYVTNKQTKRIRDNYIRMRKAVIFIQQTYRRNKIFKFERMVYINLKNKVVTIQRWYRGIVKMRKDRNEYEKMKSVAEMVGMQVKQIGKINMAAIRIQAAWRGYQCRKIHKFPVKIGKGGSRELRLTKPKETGTLNDRYKLAILNLKTSDMYSVLLNALWNIETVTQLSAKLCTGVVSEGVIDILLQLMSRANRSEPSFELCRSCTSILLNLARYDGTINDVWNALSEGDKLLHVVHIMKITCDKTYTPLFLYATTLLWILAQRNEIAQSMAKTVTMKEQLSTILETVKRKCKTNMKMKTTTLILPRVHANWFPNSDRIIFENYHFAIYRLYKQIFNMTLK